MRRFRLEYILLYLHRISVFTQNLGQTPGKTAGRKHFISGNSIFTAKKSCRGSSFLMTAYIFLWKYRLPEMALSVQGRLTKTQKAAPTATQQRGKARLPGRGIIAHRRPCCRRTHNRMYDDGHSTICRSDNHNEEGNSHSHRCISRSDGLNVPLKSS